MAEATVNTMIGVSMAIVGGIVQSFGFVAQKKGHNNVNELNKNVEKEKQKSIMTQWIWWLGLGTYSIGGITNAMALNFAAQSIIAPLSAINLATNTILSYFFLKEAITKKDIIAIVIIIIGSVIVVLFGPSSDSVDVTLDELRDNFEEVAYIVTISLLTGIIIIYTHSSMHILYIYIYIYI